MASLALLRSAVVRQYCSGCGAPLSRRHHRRRPAERTPLWQSLPNIMTSHRGAFAT
ncbi:hypothetical protein CHLRE_16g674602v5 [Chlamydomonas reinhardtii]|uniref:Uncharacterized protein n=1 Tax=Chlamydomonas reinhardtii TaxID=3055 RepID=A0A2K3CVI0_CHLRE|nr:uncharacterized protein CHLRE_16g660430v5 [Chlamydomonas reinhardtii]XP_042916125.1 uncharacterized protein CHLRE_16g674602v5 [Chlamydomonas reinhardtii]PNW71588.1 hypothetical protein CHLRE_16g660430v5 [Chlamydomonas reinhardtii]PNW72284.1 hypothetical protein CHLRE_16g674602v5 [Chlamydomonas reinhardtii]